MEDCVVKDIRQDVREDAPEKKVLLSFVGMRDPYPDDKSGAPDTSSSGSILTLCKELKLDSVYLFPSSKKKAKDPKNQTEDRAYEVKHILKEQRKSPECHILPLEVKDVTDIQELYKHFKNNLLSVLNSLSSWHPKGLSGYKFYFNTSSGTQQMSQAAQLYLSISRIRPQFYNCVAPQFADVEGRRVRLIEAPLVTETSLLARLEENAKCGYFYAAINDCASLAELTLLPERSTIAKLLGKAFAVYEAMDFMQYKEAFEGIEKIESMLKTLSLPRLGEILAEQRSFLEHVKENSEEENIHNLVDLYFNMGRAFERGNYADVLARFWRLREGIMYYRLWVNHGIDRRHLGRSKAKSLECLKKSSFDKTVNWKTMKFVKQDLSVFSGILKKVFGDTDLQAFEKQFRSKLENLRSRRNHTIVAHGMLPVAREDAEICLDIGKELIELLPGGKLVYERYPFMRENVKELVDLLKMV